MCIISYIRAMTKRKMAPVEEWITTKQAAVLLDITARHVNELIAQGVFEARKVTPRLTLVNRQSFEGWTRKRKRKEVLTE